MSENKAQITKLPVWLTNQYLEYLLQNYEKNSSIKVIEFDAKPAVSGGNNYAGLLLRCIIKYMRNEQQMQKSVIVKATVQDADEAELLSEYGTFQKEVEMYSNILPAFKSLLASIGDQDDLFPEIFHVDLENEVLVLEDLKSRGFIMADRKTGVDMKHAELVLRKIAKFHACSMVVSERKNEKYTKFESGFISENNSVLMPIFKLTLKALADEVRFWPGYEKYAVKLEEMVNFVIEQGIEIYKKNKNICVLNHGDCWVTNMLFKYDDEGNVLDVVLLDFQDNCYGSPAIDLIYFIRTSTIDDIKFYEFNKLLKHYHDIFCGTLIKLKYGGKIPTLFELNLECMVKSFYEIISVATIYPIMINEVENAGFGTLLGDNEVSKAFRKQMLANPRMQKTIKHFLPVWDNQGLLDKMHM